MGSHTTGTIEMIPLLGESLDFIINFVCMSLFLASSVVLMNHPAPEEHPPVQNLIDMLSCNFNSYLVNH